MMLTDIKNALKNYQEVSLTGDYLIFKQSQVKVKFKGLFYRFENFAEVLGEAKRPELWEILVEEPDAEADIIMEHFYDKAIKHDGFQIEATHPLAIKITTGNLRGLDYAIEALKECFIQKAENIFFYKGKINHEPSFEMRGIIEGFYGVPWSFEDRKNVISYLGQHKMNTYMYAPKDDELQRKKWRDFYDEAKLAEFKELLERSRQEKVDFFYMISPGNDIKYTEGSEIKALTDKLDQMIQLGITHFGLLLDDIDYLLKDDVAIKFTNPGNAHAYLINQVNHYLKMQLSYYTLVACPTEYDNRYGSLYLENLTENTDPEVIFFWTGPSTLASEITTEDIERMAKVFKRPMIIWDNVPVNDYLDDKETIILTPYENRSPQLGNPEYQVLGIVSNPMFQWELSTLTIDTMSDYLWLAEKYHPEESLKHHLALRFGEEQVSSLLPLVESYPNYYMRGRLNGDLAVAIETNNQEELTSYLEAVLSAHELFLANCHNEIMKQQFEPFVIRVKKDVELWQAICQRDVETIKELKVQLKESNQRVGLDMVAI